MITDINNYDIKDLREIHRYAWSFDFKAVKDLVDLNAKELKKSQNHYNTLANFALESNDFEKHDEFIKKTISTANIIPFATQSYFLTAYSLVEASLDIYCNQCKKKFNLNLGIEDLSHKGIHRAIEYLEKVVEVNNIKSNEKYGKFILLNKLRNDLIHRGGQIGKSKDYLNQLEIEVVDGKIFIEYDEVKHLIETLIDFWEFVITNDSPKRNFKINEIQDVELGSPLEILGNGKIAILKLDNNKIEKNKTIFIKRGKEKIENKILSIKIDNNEVDAISNGEVGIKLKKKIKLSDTLTITKSTKKI